MGLELIFGALSAVASVVGGIAQANATSQAAAAQREANAIEGAQQEVRNTESRRARVREARIRRARIIAASSNQGSAGSSSELGAIGALGTNLAGAAGTSQGETLAARGINTNLQRAADFQAQANAIGAWTNVFQSGFNGFRSVFD